MTNTRVLWLLSLLFLVFSTIITPANADIIYSSTMASSTGWINASGPLRFQTFQSRSVANITTTGTNIDIFRNLTSLIGTRIFNNFKLKWTAYNGNQQSLAYFSNKPVSGASESGYVGDIYEDGTLANHTRIQRVNNNVYTSLLDTTTNWPSKTWLNITLEKRNSLLNIKVINAATGTQYINSTVTDGSPYTTPFRLLGLGNGDAGKSSYIDYIELSSTDYVSRGITFTANAYYGGTSLFPFTVTFNNGTTRTNTTGNNLYFNFSNGNYTYIANATNYIPLTGSLNFVNFSSTSLLFYPNNKLKFNFKYEKDKTIVKNDSFTLICLGNNYYSLNATTNNGTYNINGLPNSVCQIRYAGYGNTINFFRPRSYFFKVPLSSVNFSNITLYQIETNFSSLFQRTLDSQFATPLTNYYLELQRFYPVGGSPTLGNWEAVEQEQADASGNTVFSAIPNTQAYRFRVLNSSLSLYSILTPSYLVNSFETLTINKTGGILTTFTGCTGISARLSNTSTTVVFDYSDTSLLASNVCLQVDRTYITTTLTNSTCSSSHAATLTRPYNLSLQGNTYVSAYANVSGTICYLAKYNFQKDTLNAKTTFLIVGPLLFVFLIILSATLSFVNPILGVASLFLTVAAFSTYALGFFAFTTLAIGGILITCIIVVYLYAKGSR